MRKLLYYSLLSYTARNRLGSGELGHLADQGLPGSMRGYYKSARSESDED